MKKLSNNKIYILLVLFPFVLMTLLFAASCTTSKSNASANSYCPNYLRSDSVVNVFLENYEDGTSEIIGYPVYLPKTR